MKKDTLKISGMSCNHCVMRVANALKGLDGVSDAVVSLDGVSDAVVSLDGGGRAEVSYDETKLDIAKLADTVADAGYTVEG